MKQQLHDLLAHALRDLDLSDVVLTITPTPDPSHGDYATNVAFQAAKKLGSSPIEAAEKIVAALNQQAAKQFEKIEVAKPGFINFTLGPHALVGILAAEHKKL